MPGRLPAGQGSQFGDIETFISDGYADAYSGMVDVVTAGFPCQPFSVAGKNKGENDPRNKWPETIDILRRVRPRYALLENVPNLLTHEYTRRIFGDLAESGFDAEWRVLSAAECGAPHKRDRVWIVAYTSGLGGRREQSAKRLGMAGYALAAPGRQQGTNEAERSGKKLADPEGVGIQGDRAVREQESHVQAGQGLSGCDGSGSGGGYWETEPNVGRVADGVASRVDRLKAIENGQVPIVAATVWRLLND